MKNEKIEKIKAIELVEKGHCHKKENNFEMALQTYYKAFKIDPHCVPALFGAAEVCLEEEKSSLAFTIISKLIEMDALYSEEYKDIFKSLAINLDKHELRDQLITLYKRAIEMDPENKVLYFKIAKTFLRAKNFAEAEVWLKKALKIDPSYKEARDLYKII